MIMKKENFAVYVTPESYAIEIMSESVLCQSLKPGESEGGTLGDEM